MMIGNKNILRKADILFGILLFLGATFFLIESIQMGNDALPITRNGFYTSPGLLPGMISLILLLLSSILIVTAWKEGARIKREDLSKIYHVIKQRESIRIFIMALIISVYIFGLLGRIPFLLATFLYLFVFMYMYKAGKLVTILLISGATAFLISYSFGNLVNIPLP